MCVPRGICESDVAQIAVSKYYVAFINGSGEIRLVRGGKSLFVEVETNNHKIFTADDVFVLKDDKQKVYSPRLMVNNNVYTVDKFIEFIRMGFQSILSAANWV
jgi:hypothetical protein